jgi:hypothetical protein
MFHSSPPTTFQWYSCGFGSNGKAFCSAILIIELQFRICDAPYVYYRDQDAAEEQHWEVQKLQVNTDATQG